MSYTPSAFDRNHIMEGNVAMAKILYISGASEIHVAITGVPPFIRETNKKGEVVDDEQGVTSPAFQAWLAKLREVGNKPITACFSAAHQMGTCRMSVAEKDGVVDPKGRVWGTEDLYVADASVFPSASGVNPMITNMAISDHISRTLVKDWKEEESM
jgi:choline dehydrogenase-like flavoprotein